MGIKKFISLKVKGATLIEVLVASIILLSCFAIATEAIVGQGSQLSEYRMVEEENSASNYFSGDIMKNNNSENNINDFLIHKSVYSNNGNKNEHLLRRRIVIKE